MYSLSLLYLCSVVNQTDNHTTNVRTIFQTTKTMNKGMYIIDLDSWTYEWVGEGTAPPFPHHRATRFAVYFYLKRAGLKEFPKRLYNVVKRFFTSSLKLSQESSENL